MSYVLIAGAAMLLQVCSSLDAAVSFDFLPSAVRVGGPAVVAIVGLVRGEPLRRVTEVFIGVLLLMVLNPRMFGSGANATVATIGMAAVVFVSASRIQRAEWDRPSAFATAWSGLLVALVLFALVAGVARTMGFNAGIHGQLP